MFRYSRVLTLMVRQPMNEYQISETLDARRWTENLKWRILKGSHRGDITEDRPLELSRNKNQYTERSLIKPKFEFPG